MHVRGLPALHHGLAHDLQVSVRLVVAGAGVVPVGLAVLPLGEDRLGGGGGHVVLEVRRTVSPHRRGRRAGAGGLYRAPGVLTLRDCDHRSNTSHEVAAAEIVCDKMLYSGCAAESVFTALTCFCHSVYNIRVLVCRLEMTYSLRWLRQTAGF